MLPVPVEYSIVTCNAGTFTHFGLYKINKDQVEGMSPNPVISIVCHVLTQNVCTDQDNKAPSHKMKFPVFFSFGGLLGTYEDPTGFDTWGNSDKESQPPPRNL